MVVDDVEDHRDPRGVGIADERLQVVRRAVRALDRERIGGVVAPRPVAGELERRHQLDRPDPEVAEVRQPPPDPVEGPRPPVHALGEGPDMELVDDEVVPRRLVEFGVAPVERVGVVDQAVPDRVGQPPRPRVDPVPLAGRRPQDEPVLVAVAGRRDVGRPGLGLTVVIADKRMASRVPVIERADDRSCGRVRRPDAERRAAGVWERAHAGAG